MCWLFCLLFLETSPQTYIQTGQGELSYNATYILKTRVYAVAHVPAYNRELKYRHFLDAGENRTLRVLFPAACYRCFHLWRSVSLRNAKTRAFKLMG